MAAIKGLNQIAQKFQSVTPQRRAQYEAGVRTPRKPWKQSTEQAAARHSEAVMRAVEEGRFARGVANATEQDWQQATIQKGPSRWVQGVQGAGSKYARNFAPYHSTIEQTNLPERFPAGDPRNYERTIAMGQALNRTKQQIKGGA